MILTPVEPFGKPCNGNPAEGIKDREGRASKQPQLRVGQSQIDFHGLTDDGIIFRSIALHV